MARALPAYSIGRTICPSPVTGKPPEILSVIGHALVKTYEPVRSLYLVFAGAYIMHEPDGVDTRQLSAVPADVYPVGHELFAIVIYSSSIAI